MRVLSYERLIVDGVARSLPNVPNEAVSALIILEQGSGTSLVNARFMETGVPTQLAGMPLGQLGTYEVVGKRNMSNFRVISADGESHTLNIQYR